MKRALQKTSTIYHYVNGERREGAPDGVTGDLSGIRGDLTGITGDLTDITGDLDDCELTPEDRARGVTVEELIGEE